MDSLLYTHITNDYYTRRYDLNPELLGGLPAVIYAECSPNKTGANNHYYFLDIYFSVGNYPVRDHIIGVSFGQCQMDKKRLDTEVDSWVKQVVNEATFPSQLKDYLKKEQMWECRADDV